MTDAPNSHPAEPHKSSLSERLNWLRAGALGANECIASMPATVVGVPGVNAQPSPILAAAMASVIGGAISMALGADVSASTPRDSQKARIEKERQELIHDPEAELTEPVALAAYLLPD